MKAGVVDFVDGPLFISSDSPRSFHAGSFVFCVALWIPNAAVNSFQLRKDTKGMRTPGLDQAALALKDTHMGIAARFHEVEDNTETERMAKE